jgi:hypothetical protein
MLERGVEREERPGNGAGFGREAEERVERDHRR